MSNIEVGNYIRDKEGNITKVLNILSLFKDVYLYLGEDGYQYSDNAISNHSKNIIDLIELGDYVNEEYVGSVNKEKKEVEIGEGWIVKQKDIKSIVTKEQFKSIEYEVE